MSEYREAHPTTIVAKLLFRGTGIYAIGSTFMSGLQSFLVVIGQKGESMLFTAANWIMYVGMGLGIVLCLLLGYFFKYQSYQEHHPDKKVKFEVKYAVAAFCTLISAVIVAYVVIFFGLGYIAPETEITQDSIAFLMALAIGGFTAYILDACLFHPIVDGSAAMAFNKTQDKIREELASEEAKKLFISAISKRANDLGLGSDKKIQALIGMVGDKGVDDPNFAMYVNLLKDAPEPE